MANPTLPPTDHVWLERFMRKTKRGRDHWMWTAGVNSQGYGTFWFRYRMWLAHRAAWELFCGPIPDGMNVLHTCDTPLCTAPRHLFLGTQRDNVLDMFRKGRANTPRGERHPRAILTEATVRAIRADTRGIVAAGAAFGVSKSLVSLVRRHERWRHVV